MKKIVQVETAKLEPINKETSSLEKEVTKIVLEEYHSKEYIENLRKQQDEEVVFILPNGKEV